MNEDTLRQLAADGDTEAAALVARLDRRRGLGTGAHARVADDYYPTPEWVARLAPVPSDAESILDPCAGEGALLLALLRRVVCDELPPEQWPHARLLGIELDRQRSSTAAANLRSALAAACSDYVTLPRLSEMVCADALDPATAWPRADACVMNPPFSLAAAFVRRAIAERYGHIACLLPISWLEPCGDRVNLVYPDGELCPDVHVLPRRPRFRADCRGSAATTCAWFVWARWRVVSSVRVLREEGDQ